MFYYIRLIIYEKLGMNLKVHNNYIEVTWKNEPYYYGTLEIYTKK